MSRLAGMYVTRWLEANLKEPSSFANGGKITNREWCRFEQSRLKGRGYDTEIVERTLPDGGMVIALKYKGGSRGEVAK